MEFIINILKNNPDFSSLLNAVEKKRLPMVLNGLSVIHAGITAKLLSCETGQKLLILCEDEALALTIRDDLLSLGVNALNLPARDYNLTGIEGYSREYEHKRIDTLSSLLDGAFDVLTASVESACQYTSPPEILKQNRFVLNTGGTLDTEEFTKKLVDMGYTRCGLVEGIGQFSVRGGIIDLYPANLKNPLRIELWGDEIDSLSYFEVMSQRRGDSIDEITVYPAREIIYNDSELKKALEDYSQKAKNLSDKQYNTLIRDIDALKNGLGISPDNYLSLVFEHTATLFDYFNGISVVYQSGNVFKRLETLEKQFAEDVNMLLEEGLLSRGTSKLYLDKGELLSKLKSPLFIENFPRNSYEIPIKEVINFSLKRSGAWSGNIDVLKEDISYMLTKKGTVVILAGEEKSAKVLISSLEAAGVPATYLSHETTDLKGGVYVTTGGLSSGFELPLDKFLLITHRFIAGDRRKKKYKSKNAKSIGSLDELKVGDYVVHASHGIGIFEGINQITQSGITKDYIKIRYQGTDNLYVPVTQLDLVSKYIGAAEGTLKLNKLGSKEWNNTRRRVKAAVRDMAKQLTELYAKRMSTKGYSFLPDTDLQNDFERRFEYEETEDQLICINEIKRDMEKAVPMDRLLCGDVGFGKTEVALRAAFKCVSEGKQCALLCPTTILAMQHFNTTLRRFGEMPVTVKLLSRFSTPKQQKEIVRDLKLGKIDMIIGTHRLISKDVEFRNIGLVIIDEEQRFGVAQKERLKELYPFVDILTLSATPIPRTLNMAMSGLRDMSSIDEAPLDRHPVQSYVVEQNLPLLVDAIKKELRRGGQVYYIHNHVGSIAGCAAKLMEKLPEARFGIAHGKMTEDELSNVWQALIDHEIDVLVCTTIIETGVDVPNVNTLIIENADRMGLSQLHQLRGRVGRSPRRAYAYFCFKADKQLSEIASKRLEAIREFTEFGSGFKIALRDLEIRGAGNILGADQHGNMESVGYDMYLKLLSDAVNEENGIVTNESEVCTVDLNISAHIPERYIESLPARLGVYKRIADIKTDDDVTDIIDELIDRFGEPPKQVLGLIDIALLRNKATLAGITEIVNGPMGIILKTPAINPETASKLADSFGNKFTLATTGDSAYIIKTGRDKKIIDIASDIMKAL